jgi:hypothetical protein
MRGAANKILQLTPEEIRRGVITYSSGNHAQAVAYVAREVGAKAVIVMPSNAPAIKRAGTLALGAEIVDVGVASSERLAMAEKLVREHGYVVVPPYDDEQIIAGQATCGLEIVEALPDVDLVLSPVSGGGLLSGVAAAVKQLASPGQGLRRRAGAGRRHGGDGGFLNVYIQSIFLGIVEGLTEFLPVSSTAHLRITEALMKIPLDDAYWKMYTIVIQLGAILALLLLFLGRIVDFMRTFPKGENGDRNWLNHPISLTLIAFAFTSAPALLLHKWSEKNLGSLNVMAWRCSSAAS